MSNEFTVRKAAPSDAQEMSYVHAQAWREAYRELIPADYLQNLRDDHWVELFSTILSDGSTTTAWVVLQENKVIACASVCPSRYKGYEGNLELVSIYCLPEFWGKGCGHALIKEVKKYASENSFLRIALWVLDGNESAIKFYERQGFWANGGLLHVEIGGADMVEKRFVCKV
jgi:GNAT superfamily N-acetyltransferase